VGDKLYFSYLFEVYMAKAELIRRVIGAGFLQAALIASFLLKFSVGI